VSKTLIIQTRQQPGGTVVSASRPPQGLFSRGTGGTRFTARPMSPHAGMAPMYWACVDLLTLAGQLAQGAVPSTAAQLRNTVHELFRSMAQKGADAGLVPEDLTDARYALVALFDEILVRTNWPGRSEWQASPLQFEQFHENTAGENFFNRADMLCNQPHRAHVLQIYFLCLSLGFQGRYTMAPPGELESAQRQIAAVIQGSSIPAEMLSPHGIPTDADQTILQREAPIVRLGLAFFAAALIFFCGLFLTRSIQLGHALEPMRAFSAQGDRPGTP
jgi:type VI secretion system protein ImpK